MARNFITIGLLVLVTTVSTVIPNKPSDGVSTLGYNPTYDLWFFVQGGRPVKLTKTIMDAYKMRKPGGVCHKPVDDWFFCKTGEKIQ
ncbi:hypothetical protein ACLKA6_009366 [Drosophila palustris]